MSSIAIDEFKYVECKDINILIEELNKYIFNKELIAEVYQAYFYAENKHKNQIRKSGDPFIYHPLSTAYYLAQWRMSPRTVIAGLLHDIIEDTPVIFEEIEQLFGTDIANIVESVTKTSFFAKENREQMKSKYLRKLMLSMIRDIRVIIVKIADRMHNILTLNFMPPDKQYIIAKETLEIYSTIAHRIGMKIAKNLLEDYSFRYLNPEEYSRVSYLLDEDKIAREQMISEIIAAIKAKIDSQNTVEKYEIYGRSKSIYSIYRKMTMFGRSFSDINDILAIRIVTKKVDECYAVLGWIHQIYIPISGKFKDYIATPKNNLYQSLHTTIATKEGVIFEVQIRTYEMEETAMHGAAAHWKYKESEGDISIAEKQKEIDKKVDMFTRILNLEKLAIENEEIEYGSEMEKLETEMEETIKSDYITSLIYILTPEGQVITLPFGSTVLDFAYKIHTDIGDHTVGAKINGVFSPFNTTLESGEMVDVQTSSEIEPQEKWLKFVRTSTARKAIEKFLDFKRQNTIKKEEISKQKIIRKTKKEIDKYIIDNNLKWKINTQDEIQKKLNVLDYKNIDDFLLSIARDDFSIKEAVEFVFVDSPSEMSSQQLKDIKTRKYKSTSGRSDLQINDMNNLNATLAECCYPLPNEPIIAFMSKTKGIQVHLKECSNILNIKNIKNILKTKWIFEEIQKYDYKVRIKLITSTRPGLLQAVTQILTAQRVNIYEIKLSTSEEEMFANSIFGIEVRDVNHLKVILTSLKEVPGVKSVMRISTTDKL